MKQLTKTALATAVGLAVSCAASAATFEQFKMGQKSIAEFIDISKPAAIEGAEVQQTPSSYLVVLNQDSLASLKGADTEKLNARSVQIEDVQRTAQADLALLDSDAVVLGTTKNIASALLIQASAQTIEAFRSNPNVVGIYPNYDSKPLAVASAESMKATKVVQEQIATGAGVTVAILDTGVDYTHAAVGGTGTVEAYNAQNPSVAPTWPQGRVLGGYDFVNRDANPLDPRTQGHGTYVASSVAAVAPDAKFYAYTVCAASCSAANQISALDASMDPNGDGDISDRVDVVNMSLGGQMGTTQTTSGTQFLIHQAAKLGVNMVISAGNDGPNPFIVGGPSTTPNALSVGAMTHAADKTGVYSKNTFAGKPLTMVAAGFSAKTTFSFTSATNPLVYVASNGTACADFEAGSLTGKVVIIDRGTCNFDAKAIRAQAAGAVFVILANNVTGNTPVNAGGSAPELTIPVVGISKEDGDRLKAAIADGTAEYEIESLEISTNGGTATFTSRGPAMSGLLKPEITAPGTNIVMAAVGTGSGTAKNSGTSFSGPLTAGAVALLREALPNHSAQEIKAKLMNTADMEVYDRPKAAPGAKLAPISAIGAGLVNVEKAVKLPVAAWVQNDKFDTAQAALSFGLVNLTETTTLTKTVTLKNFSTAAKTYTLTAEQRFEENAQTGALTWHLPASVTVQAGQTLKFDVSVTIDPSKLPEWELANTSAVSEKNDLLTAVEFDGAIVFNDASTEDANDLQLVYHMMPRANAKLVVKSQTVDGKSIFTLTNTGAVAADVFATTLVADSPKKEGAAFDIRTASLEVIDVPTSYCSSGLLLAPTFTLEEGINHVGQVGLSMDIDTNSDGVWDYSLSSLRLDRLGYTGVATVMGTFTTRYGTTSGSVADLFHSVGQKNVTLAGCFNAMGLTAADVGKSVRVRFSTNTDGTAIGYGWGTPISDEVTATVALNRAPSVRLTAVGSGSNQGPTEVNPAEITSLEPGATAQVQVSGASGAGLVLLSSVGGASLSAPAQAANPAPVIAAQSFTVSENAAAGTVIGTIEESISLLGSAVAAEYIVAGSSSTAVTVNAKGQVVVVDGSLLDYEAGLTSIEIDVIAVSATGKVSAPATITIAVENVADEKPVATFTQTKTALVATVTNPGLVFGTLDVAVKESGATLESVTLSSTLFAYADGKVTQARQATSSEVGIHKVTITATDSAGLVSEPVTFEVGISAAPAPAPAPELKKSSGGFGWLALMLAPLALLRRRQK